MRICNHQHSSSQAKGLHPPWTEDPWLAKMQNVKINALRSGYKPSFKFQLTKYKVKNIVTFTNR